jgi:cytochrome c oxidase subunit 2
MRSRRILPAGLCALAIAAIPSPRASADVPPRVIEIKAKKFEFSPSQLTLRKGETVTLRLVSEDRVHGFFQRALGVDADIDPAKASDVTLTPMQPGTYQVICDHYCGYGHGNMNMTITVE